MESADIATRVFVVGGLGPDRDDGNVDVHIYFEGRRYSGTFFTLRNVRTLLDRWRVSGEHLHGLYFWACDGVIVESLAATTIRRVVDDLVSEGYLSQVFGQPFEVDPDEELGGMGYLEV